MRNDFIDRGTRARIGAHEPVSIGPAKPRMAIGARPLAPLDGVLQSARDSNTNDGGQIRLQSRSKRPKCSITTKMPKRRCSTRSTILGFEPLLGSALNMSIAAHGFRQIANGCFAIALGRCPSRIIESTMAAIKPPREVRGRRARARCDRLLPRLRRTAGGIEDPNYPEPSKVFHRVPVAPNQERSIVGIVPKIFREVWSDDLSRL